MKLLTISRAGWCSKLHRARLYSSNPHAERQQTQGAQSMEQCGRVVKRQGSRSTTASYWAMFNGRFVRKWAAAACVGGTVNQLMLVWLQKCTVLGLRVKASCRTCYSTTLHTTSDHTVELLSWTPAAHRPQDLHPPCAPVASGRSRCCISPACRTGPASSRCPGR